MFYLVVLRPALRRGPVPEETTRTIGEEFRGIVNTAIAVLLITGIILSASRLTSDSVPLAYVVVMAVKIALALYMFYIVRFLRRRAYPEDAASSAGWWSRLRGHATGNTGVLILGVVVIGLADVLGALFENSLTN